MATHQRDVSVYFGVPAGSSDPDPSTGLSFDVAVGLVRVPDVTMLSERQARTRIEAAGLRSGRRIPVPVPASRCSEVVVRTTPRGGAVVPADAIVDLELLPGEPRQGDRASGYVDHDAAACLPAAKEPTADTTRVDSSDPYVDYDAIDTLHRVGCEPFRGRA